MWIDYRDLPDRRFGIELEVDANISKLDIGDTLIAFENESCTFRSVVVTPGLKGWAESRGNRYWHVKYDSTCGRRGKHKDHGWEVASFIATGFKDLQSIALASEALRASGARTTRNCGMHIHVDVSDFDAWHMGLLLANWLKVERYMYAICPIRRHENPYCRSIRSRANTLQAVYNYRDPSGFWYQMAPTNYYSHDNNDKKFALNTVGWACGQILKDYDRKTIELRIPEGLLEKNHVKAWTVLFLAFVDSVVVPRNIEDASCVSEVLSILGLQGNSHCFLLLEKSLWEAKCWLLDKLSRSVYLTSEERNESRDLLKQISCLEN